MPKATLPSGHTWAYVDANPTGKTTLLCLHGFPDLGYGFRLQIAPWARAGFRVVVPDMLGYGGSDAPVDALEYTTKRLTSDLAALLTKLGVDRAVIVGHDWGAFTAGRFVLWHPERVITLILMSVAHTQPAPQRLTLRDVVQRVPNYGYQLFLASDESPALIEAKLPTFLSLIFAPAQFGIDFTTEGKLARLLDSPRTEARLSSNSIIKGDVLRAYTAAFTARGLRGPTNYYRTTTLRYEEESTANPPLHIALPSKFPTLFIYGVIDPTLADVALKSQRKLIPRLEETQIPNTGHWVLFEHSSYAEEPPAFLEEGTPDDPLAGWREKTSAGAWKEHKGDGGPVGRTVIQFLANLGIDGKSVAPAKL
ncbi:Epoxide hydrolase hydrolase [Mycena indigotica]|uniref:Epoxide hydrolase hydrolase n=1 Tax=Mycena indigotica TaxID=2126181 RepID=A0A8H6SLM7_9AGAR|nr:Epoxide hydrolase hydrolase [Mycena indigotica]KAF7302030.1 Epoxide hydrolase hydrolase [Mycena indigotica]